MKRVLFTVLASVATSITAGAQQWDSLYYRPNKTVVEIESVAHRESIEQIDGNSLHIIETVPDGDAKGIVYIYHGNAENITGKNMQSVMATLTEAGYIVRTFDYPGFGRSTGTPTHEAIGKAAREHFRRTISDTPSDIRVILYGRSIGAQIAATLAAENGDRVKALVIDGGSPSFKTLALLFAPVEVHHYIEQYMVDPYSVEQALPRLKGTKVLFMHAQNDMIPQADIRKLYDNFTGEKSFWSYDTYHIEAATIYPDEFIARLNTLIGNI